jgi:hypothetical protein
MPVEHGLIKQIAYVVDDLDAAIARWVEVVRAGPFFRIDGASVAAGRYRGQRVEADPSLAAGGPFLPPSEPLRRDVGFFMRPRRGRRRAPARCDRAT